MGLQRDYNENGGFSNYLYYQIGETITASNGVEAKIVSKIDGSPYDGLPTFSKTGEMYLRVNSDGKVVQARIYKNRKVVCDFDWNHTHQNKNGQKFENGTVHVQEFRQKADGTWERQSKKARYMTNDEIARYGELIKKIAPYVKLKP